MLLAMMASGEKPLRRVDIPGLVTDMREDAAALRRVSAEGRKAQPSIAAVYQACIGAAMKSRLFTEEMDKALVRAAGDPVAIGLLADQWGYRRQRLHHRIATLRGHGLIPPCTARVRRRPSAILEAAADAAAVQSARRKVTLRACLMCGQQFRRTIEFVCPACKRTEQWKAGVE